MKTKYIGLMHPCKDWPPDLGQMIQKTLEKTGILPNLCLLHPESPEIVLKDEKIRVIRSTRVPKGFIWLTVTIIDYGNHILHLAPEETRFTKKHKNRCAE